LLEASHALGYELFRFLFLPLLEVLQQVLLEIAFLYLRFVSQILGLDEKFCFHLLHLPADVSGLVCLELVTGVYKVRVVAHLIEVTVEHNVECTKTHAQHAQ